MTSNANLGAYGIMYVIENKKNEVISLLLKNGVAIPSNATNLQIGVIVTNLLKSSKSFASRSIKNKPSDSSASFIVFFASFCVIY